MRRTLTLRIGGMPADLNSDALILFNYTAERMDSPAAVKNSYSQQVKLPGTPGNAALFGRFWRADRRTVPDATRQTGVNFDALRRTPFEILAGGGEILERGYCKLDSVTRRGDLVTGYAVTLYGGLGSFYYSLAYKDDGDGKKTLADLSYVTGAANELDFDINAAAVSDAWLRLRTQEQGAARWDIINFAPTYGGLPEGTFDASKALFKPGAVGLPTEVDGKKPAAGGWSLCDLGTDRTEMEVKDFRSYLQRPVLSVKKFIEACCNPANNGGWAVRLDPAFFNANNPYYEKAWMTLPRLDSLTLPAEHRGGSLELSGPAVTVEMTPASTRSALGQIANAAFKVELFAEPRLTLTENAGSRPLYWNSTFRTEGSQAHTAHIRHGLFLQLVIRDVDNNPLAVSKSVLFHSTDYNGDALTAEEFATAAGYTPVTVGGEAPGYDSVLGWFTANGTAASWHGGRAALSVEGSLIGAEDATVELIATPVRADYLDLGTPIIYPWMTLWGSRGGALENEPVTFVAASVPVDVTTARYSADTLTEVHTGAHITKAILLSTDKTPADYLFSYCKLFGLKFLTDRASNTVHILSRGTFYTGDRTDLEGRIDRAQDVQTVPYAVAAKWYEFGLETPGAYADYYRKIRGRVFGTQRVNTGFEFDANTVGVLDGSAFRGAVEVMEQSKLFCNPTRTVNGADYPMPAVFLAGGCKYSLYDGDGSAEYDTGSNADSIDYMNEIFRGYDAVSRVQMHGEDGKALDGSGVLLFFRGFQSGGGAMSRFALTDDTSVMASLNGGTPCWILEAGDTYQPFPLFGRYLWDGANVSDSWDLGRPAEVDIPGATYPAGTEIYSRFWAAFMADRYHRDTRVVTAWVDLRGMYVGEPLMRRFFAFDGALWALNKIIDHDIIGGHLTKCEFVKVEEPGNYTEE